MNGKDRILKTLKHEKVDRVPWVPLPASMQAL
jgi:uroporphyrinogen-III decarboxylase